jgi:hypothetical protein
MLIPLCVLFSLVFFAPLKVMAATIIIAASNSSSQWKSQATATCTGTSDQNAINKYLTTGSTVDLAPGTFNCNGSINPASNSHLYGQGNTTIINLQTANISAINVNNIELDHFEVTGNANGGGAIFLACDNASDSGFNINNIECTCLGVNDYEVYANADSVPSTISNVVFSACDASNPDGDGFYIGGEGTSPSMLNTTFYKCTVENAGVASTRTGSWIVGFDFNEGAISAVNHLQVINCSVNGAWESGFYMEDSNSAGTSEQDYVITGCNATNCGQKPTTSEGFGYLIGSYPSTIDDVIEYGNTASNNALGTMLVDGTIYSSIVNGISPVSSVKTATAVSQSNCSGVIVNTDSTHKELVLYSTDGNPVNQSINLGGYYASNDGNTYAFSGESIIAQFTDYAVIRLVETAPPTNITWDVNNDGSVNTLDIILTIQHFGETGTPGWIKEDVNDDGVINILDVIAIGQHFS